MRLPPIRQILVDTWNGYNKHHVSDLAAMLTYYAVFALFPFAVFLVTMTLLVLPKDVLENAFTMLAVALPRQMQLMALENLHRLEQTASSGFAIASAAIALWGASRGAAALQTALNEIHDVEETRPWWKVQVVAILTTIGLSGLILVALMLLLLGPAVGHLLMDRFGLGAEIDAASMIGRWIAAPALVMFIWGCLYFFLPDMKRRFRWITPGAVIGVVLWLVASRAFIFFADHFASYDRTYGALAAVIVFLTWIWISCMALLIGGEIDDTIHDWRKQPKEKENIVEDRRLVPQRELGVTDLARRVGEDITTLAKNHFELARSELSTGVKGAFADAAAILLGGIVALVGLAMLCVTLVVAVEPIVPVLSLRLLGGALLYIAVGALLIMVCVRRLRGGEVMKETQKEAGRTSQLLEETVQHG